MDLITSSNNSLIKHLAKLNKSSAYRNESKTFLIEGKKLIQEWLEKAPLKNLLIEQNLPSLKDINPIYLKKELCQKISALKTNDGYFAEVEFPKKPDLKKVKKLLVIDKIQDPKNLGALIRSALAFSFDAIFILDGSVDPYSPKVIRASMGAVLHTPLYKGSSIGLKEFVQLHNLTLYIADASGLSIDELNIKTPFALVLGNEANDSDLKNETNIKKVSIPIENVDSLNVAIAGSLLMFQLKGTL